MMVDHIAQSILHLVLKSPHCVHADTCPIKDEDVSTSSCSDSSSRHRWRAAQVPLESSLVSLAFSKRGAANAFEKQKKT